MMEGAYGGHSAGGDFNPILFVQRPQVILRAVSWFFSIIVFGCISSQGWARDPTTGEEQCLYNNDGSACNYGVGISVIAFLATMGFIVGEFMFERMSNVKTRKRYVMADLGFSGLWTFLYFVGFCYLTNQWNKSTAPPGNIGVSNMQAAIAFCFFSIFTWAGLAYLAFGRYKVGAASAFAPSAALDPSAVPEQAYQSYPEGGEQGGYAPQPFGGAPQPQEGQQQIYH